MKKLSLMLLIVILMIVCVLNIRVRRVDVTSDKNIYLLRNVNEIGSYNLIDSNKIECDLTTFSYIVHMMEKDGYVLEEEEYTNEYIDIILASDSLKVRMYYTIDGNLISICDTYEKSYIPLTYINEEKEKKEG